MSVVKTKAWQYVRVRCRTGWCSYFTRLFIRVQECVGI